MKVWRPTGCQRFSPPRSGDTYFLEITNLSTSVVYKWETDPALYGGGYFGVHQAGPMAVPASVLLIGTDLYMVPSDVSVPWFLWAQVEGIVILPIGEEVLTIVPPPPPPSFAVGTALQSNLTNLAFVQVFPDQDSPNFQLLPKLSDDLPSQNFGLSTSFLHLHEFQSDGVVVCRPCYELHLTPPSPSMLRCKASSSPTPSFLPGAI